MKRRQFVLSACAATALPAWARGERFAQGLLWRVTKKGLPPSHVFGTIHDADPRLDGIGATVNAVLDGSKILMVEFLPDPYTQQRFTEAARFFDRQTLEQHIGAQDFARVVEKLAPIGLAPQFINKLKPWGVLINLRHPRASVGTPLDAQLVARARARRLAVGQIEGVEEQIFTFDECPMESQIALLRHSLAHGEELVELAGRTVEAYLQRDLSSIWHLREAFIARYPDVASHQAIMTKRVLHDRSVVMAFRMQRELRRGDALVAVGALHLYGSNGVLAQLEQDGYRAMRVY